MIPPQICFTSLSQAEISFVQNVSARKKNKPNQKTIKYNQQQQTFVLFTTNQSNILLLAVHYSDS